MVDVVRIKMVAAMIQCSRLLHHAVIFNQMKAFKLSSQAVSTGVFPACILIQCTLIMEYFWFYILHVS